MATEKTEAWLSDRVAYIKGLKTATEQQKLIVVLYEKQNPTAQEQKKLAVLVRAEKAAVRANEARQRASAIINAEKRAEAQAERKARNHELYNAAGLLIMAGLVDTKTGKPLMDKATLLGALMSLGKVPQEDNRWQGWKTTGSEILAKESELVKR